MRGSWLNNPCRGPEDNEDAEPMDASHSTTSGINETAIREISSRYSASKINERFRLTGELRCPKAGEWYWWTGKYGPAACRADVDRPFNAPILVERVQGFECADFGPFVVQETPSADGKTYYVSIERDSGIVTTGRVSRGEADADRKALNAAYWLGREHKEPK